MNEEKTYESKQSFLTYLSSFFTGWITKDLIEEEIRHQVKRPKLPPVGLSGLFSGEGLKSLKEGLGDSAVWKHVGKELSIEGASILPGALLGYACLKPVVTHFTMKPAPVIHEGATEGKVQAEPAASIQK